MTQHKRKPEHHGQKHPQQGGNKSKSIHKDWRAWLLVVIMLAGILMYVFSDNESLQPGGAAGTGIPADVPPAEAAE